MDYLEKLKDYGVLIEFIVEVLLRVFILRDRAFIFIE